MIYSISELEVVAQFTGRGRTFEDQVVKEFIQCHMIKRSSLVPDISIYSLFLSFLFFIFGGTGV
jgi:hypothetical protein